MHYGCTRAETLGFAVRQQKIGFLTRTWALVTDARRIHTPSRTATALDNRHVEPAPEGRCKQVHGEAAKRADTTRLAVTRHVGHPMHTRPASHSSHFNRRAAPGHLDKRQEVRAEAVASQRRLEAQRVVSTTLRSRWDENRLRCPEGRAYATTQLRTAQARAQHDVLCTAESAVHGACGQAHGVPVPNLGSAG